jgi:hypothetical protein
LALARCSLENTIFPNDTTANKIGPILNVGRFRREKHGDQLNEGRRKRYPVIGIHAVFPESGEVLDRVMRAASVKSPLWAS